MADKKKIVIADDEPIILSTLSDILSDKYQIYTAANGRQAISEVEKTKPDMVILDVMMPEMDGIEACRQLKKNKATSAIPVILLTVKGMAMDIEIGIKSGADLYVIKPFSPEKLIEKVEEIFKKNSH